jgi:hypothetical protein
MNDTPRRERRSPMIVVLDAAFGLAAALQTGHLPGRRTRAVGEAAEGETGEGRRVRRGVGLAWLTVGILAAIAGTVILAVTFVRAPDGLASLPPTVSQQLPPTSAVPSPATASPSSSITPSSSPAPSVTPSVSPSQTPGAVNRSIPQPPPAGTAAVPLTARYAADEGGAGLLGYRATVTVTNPGRGPKTGWVLTVKLPRPTLAVDQVSGATAKQDGSTWTFTPDQSTNQIPPGGSVAVAFSVRGATLLAAAPQDCRIDGNPCAGLQN